MKRKDSIISYIQERLNWNDQLIFGKVFCGKSVKYFPGWLDFIIGLNVHSIWVSFLVQ